MIALLEDDRYYYDDKTNIRDFLISYAKYISVGTKIFEVLARSEEMSIGELVEYINNHCYTGESIIEIYEIGKKLF